MSDQPGTESFDDDLGSVSLDDAVDAGSGEPDLLDASEGDNLPATPPDQQSRATEWGTTASEQAAGETIDQRISQEEPDPDSAYGAPDNESGLDGPSDEVGGDDVDAIDAADDFLGDSAEGSADAETAEESAMRIVEE
ncbi:adenosine deaminase [Knoellia sp. CPCC 206453]|uniref:adenosine deaminase n=1 Tax=Knoellia pratensis TaxID=3404796 RepID=UPI0036100BB5